MFTKFKNLNDCKLRSCMYCSFILNAFLIICTSGKIAVIGGWRFDKPYRNRRDKMKILNKSFTISA